MGGLATAGERGDERRLPPRMATSVIPISSQAAPPPRAATTGGARAAVAIVVVVVLVAAGVGLGGASAGCTRCALSARGGVRGYLGGVDRQRRHGSVGAHQAVLVVGQPVAVVVDATVAHLGCAGLTAGSVSSQSSPFFVTPSGGTHQVKSGSSRKVSPQQ